MDITSKPARRFSFDAATVWILTLALPIAALIIFPGLAIPLASSKVTILAFGAILAFIAFVIARIIKGNIVAPPWMLLAAIWLVPLAYALSSLFSGSSFNRSFFGVEFETDTFGFIILLAVLASLVAFAFRRADDMKRFFQISAVALALIIAAQIVFLITAAMGGPVAATDNVFGSFADLGMMVGLGIIVSLLAFRFLALSQRTKIALWVGIAIGFFILMLANSGLVWTMVALAAGALFIEAVMRRRGHGDDTDLEGVSTVTEEYDSLQGGELKSLGVPLVCLLVSLFFLIGGSTIANSIAASMGVNIIDVRPSWQSTFTVGSHTYASSPLFGSGPGTFSEEWLKFRDQTLNETIFWNIDFTSGIGFIPTSFVTTGIVGALAWIAFILFFLYTGLRSFLFHLPQEPFMRFASLASFIGALFILICALFATPGAVVLATGFMLLGIFISTLRFGKNRREIGIVFSRAPRLGFVVVFLLTLLLLGSVGGAYVVIERSLSHLAYAEAATAAGVGDIARAEAAANRSITLAPSERAYRLLSATGIERMARIANDTTLSPASAQQEFQAALSASIAAGMEATRLGPDDYQNWTALGNVYRSVSVLNIEGAYAEAKRTYETAATLNPTTPILPFIIAQLELSQGQAGILSAEEKLMQSISLKRDYVPAILLLSQLEVQQGKAREALQAAEAAAYFAPDDPSVLLQVGLLRSGTGDIAGAIAALSRAVEVNPQYANARFFLGALHAYSGNTAEALAQLQFVGALSPENQAAVQPDIDALESGRNPFTLARLRTLGIPQPPVSEPAPAAEAPQQ